MNLTRFWATTVAAALLAGQTIAAIWHVAPDGLNSNNGSELAPFLTIQKAATNTAPGDTVMVRAGAYDEVVNTSIGGEQGLPIIFDGQGVAKLKRMIIDKPHIVLRGFTLTGESKAGSSCIFIDDGGHYALLTNNVLNPGKTTNVHGILMAVDTFTNPSDTNAPRHCLIISNYVGNILGATAMHIGGRFNVVKHNTITNIYTSDFMRLFGHTNLIENNRFINNIFQEGIGNHPDFIQTFGENRQASLGHIIHGNIVSNIMGGQIAQLTMVNSFNDGQHGGWIFRNNIFVDIAWQASAGIPNVRWLHNLFLRCSYEGSHALALGYSEGRSNAEGAVVLNNLFIDCGAPPTSELQSVIGWYARSITNLVADHNFVAKGPNFRAVRQENPPTSFRWFEPGGINGGDPGLRDLVQLDVRLNKDSRLKNAGRLVPEAATDFYGNPRSANPNIGPFEDVPVHLTPPERLRVVQ